MYDTALTIAQDTVLRGCASSGKADMNARHPRLIGIGSSAWILLLTCAIAWAHIDLEPKTTIPNRWETFVLNVPTETDSATVEVQLLIPEGFEVESVGHRPEWDIAIQRNAQGVVREIVWAGGRIPPLTFEEFKLLTKTPKTPGTFEWQGRQRYASDQDSTWTMRTIIQDGSDGSPTQKAEEAVNTAQTALTISLLGVGMATVLLVVMLVALWRGAAGRGPQRE